MVLLMSHMNLFCVALLALTLTKFDLTLNDYSVKFLAALLLKLLAAHLLRVHKHKINSDNSL